MGAHEDREEVPPERGLAALIEVERRIERDLAEAGAEAERIVAAARDEVLHRKEAAEGELLAAVDALRERILRECEESVRVIDAQASSEAARFEGVDDRRVEVLGRFVAERLGRGGVAG